MTMQPDRRVCLMGAADDTGNLGVSALMHSVVAGIAGRTPSAQLTVFDNGWGLRPDQASVGERTFNYQRCGIRLSRRYHRPESIANIRLSAKFGGVGNPGAQAIRNAQAVWDVSGGDSFSDLYGPKRFRLTTLAKRIVLEQGIPLVLLPQTYGPFAGASARRFAQQIVGRAAMAWARDPDSFTALQELLGTDFDPQRHRQGVDLAFGLPVQDPGPVLANDLRIWLAEPRAPTVGLNVSGLLYNDSAAASRYGLKADYRRAIRTLLAEILSQSDGRVLLVPHVVGLAAESDEHACADLASLVQVEHGDRVRVAPGHLSAGQVKGLIARMDWFCGTRMHSTIAALSSGVPTAAIAYSLKTRGVFDTCGQAAQVIDARQTDTDAVVVAVLISLRNRQRIRADLAERLPATLARASELMDELCLVGLGERAIEGVQRA